MPSARVKAVVGSALAVLGFRTKADGWSFSVINEPQIVAELGGTTVLLSAPGTKLSIAVKRPLAEDFVPRLRKRLGSLKKRAARAEKRTKKASREAARAAGTPSAARQGKEETCYSSAARTYDSIAYCSDRKHFTRQSLMVSEDQCGDCAGWPTVMSKKLLAGWSEGELWPTVRK